MILYTQLSMKKNRGHVTWESKNVKRAFFCVWLRMAAYTARVLYQLLWYESLRFDFCICFPSFPIPNRSQLGSISAPKWLSGGLPMAFGPGF